MNSWLLQVFIILAISSIASYLQVKLFNKVIAKLRGTRNFWDHTFLSALKRPLQYAILLFGLSLIAKVYQAHHDMQVYDAIQPYISMASIILIVWFLIRFIRWTEKNLLKQKRNKEDSFDPTTINAVTKLLCLVVVIIGALVVMQNMGYSLSGVLAFGGVGGIAIGFAARDLLANFFGGLMIYLDRPFKVGDWVRSPDREIEGTVEKIGWRQTTIRTFDKRPLYVPNSVFNTIAIENPSRMSNRRIKETIGIRYDDANKMDVIVRDVKQMLEQHEEIDTTQTLIVNFNAYASSSLDFFVYTFTKTTDWIRYHEIKQDVMLKILDIIDSHGAECAFPTSTLHVADIPLSNNT